MNILSKLLHKLAVRLEGYSCYTQLSELRSLLGECHETSVFKKPEVCTCPKKIFLDEHTSIYEGARFIISPIGEKGRFIMKSHSYAAQGLTVITGSHTRQVGKLNLETAETHKYDIDKDVIVEEEVGIGVGVTLLAGVKVGRGATIGAGSVVMNNVPPYAVVMGNPAQVVGFVFTPEQIIEHEKSLYPEAERLPLAKLEKNYQRYYVNHINDIAKYTNISL
jgi:acetyltransferase-like isoleucine patch superfamily enzyme